jgi:hypothetical protein
MHLRTPVESLDGLTPDAATLDQMAHKMPQNAETGADTVRSMGGFSSIIELAPSRLNLACGSETLAAIP